MLHTKRTANSRVSEPAVQFRESQVFRQLQKENFDEDSTGWSCVFLRQLHTAHHLATHHVIIVTGILPSLARMWGLKLNVSYAKEYPARITVSYRQTNSMTEIPKLEYICQHGMQCCICMHTVMHKRWDLVAHAPFPPNIGCTQGLLAVMLTSYTHTFQKTVLSLLPSCRTANKARKYLYDWSFHLTFQCQANVCVFYVFLIVFFKETM